MSAPPPEAEVIIVGSGPAGVSAAWPLVQAGVRVLMLDASDSDGAAEPLTMRARGERERWRSEIGYSGPIADSAVSPKFATPLAQTVLGCFAEVSRIDAQHYMALGSHAAGGLSRIWGALAAQYAEADLAALPQGGAAVRAGYAHVARRIGIMGGAPLAQADMASLSPVIAHLIAHYQRPGATPGVDLITAPNAVITEPRGERRGCSQCGQCLYGCPRDSIYHSALELPALRLHPNFTYRSGVVVERLSDDDGPVVEGRIGREAVKLRARAVVLAAGTLATTSLALRRIGHVGVPVRLLNNPVGGIGFLVPRMIGRALPERAFGLGQLFYTTQPEAGTEAAGVLYGADTLPLAPVADRLPFTRPVALRAARALAPALILATSYLPGRYSDNQLVVEEERGVGRMRIFGGQPAATDRLLDKSFDRLAATMRAGGAWTIPGSRQKLLPGADAHPAGTLPMGGAGPAATDREGALNGAPGVYIADGAALPILSARHPTLTIMANADGIGRALARRLIARPDIARAG